MENFIPTLDVVIDNHENMIPDTPQESVVFTTISNLISDCWRTIDSYNSAYMTLKDYATPEIIDTFSVILNNEIDKVSQLLSMLELSEPIQESLESIVGALSLEEKDSIANDWKAFAANPDAYKNTLVVDHVRKYLLDKRKEKTSNTETPAEQNAITESFDTYIFDPEDIVDFHYWGYNNYLDYLLDVLNHVDEPCAVEYRYDNADFGEVADISFEDGTLLFEVPIECLHKR